MSRRKRKKTKLQSVETPSKPVDPAPAGTAGSLMTRRAWITGTALDIYVGAVVALPLADGKEQPGKPFVGGVGTPEMRERFSESTYEITIRLDEGGFTQVTRRDGASYRIGDRVRVSGTQLELLAP